MIEVRNYTQIVEFNRRARLRLRWRYLRERGRLVWVCRDWRPWAWRDRYLGVLELRRRFNEDIDRQIFGLPPRKP